jgi:hypothetical protein
MRERVWVRVRDLVDDEGNRRLRIVQRASAPVVMWRRAQMVLLSARGMDVAPSAEVSFTSPDRVRARYARLLSAHARQTLRHRIGRRTGGESHRAGTVGSGTSTDVTTSRVPVCVRAHRRIPQSSAIRLSRRRRDCHVLPCRAMALGRRSRSGDARAGRWLPDDVLRRGSLGVGSRCRAADRRRVDPPDATSLTAFLAATAAGDSRGQPPEPNRSGGRRGLVVQLGEARTSPRLRREGPGVMFPPSESRRWHR